MMGRFAGKVMLVTGGSRGLGRAAALWFAREGARVAVVARGVAEGEDTVQEIWESGGSGIFIRADVSRSHDCSAMVADVEEVFGGLDIAFNAASITDHRKLLADESASEWDGIVAMNLKGASLSMKYEIPAMLRRGGGAIVNVSRDGPIASPAQGACAASKGGVLDLTGAYAQHGIRIHALCADLASPEVLADLLDDSRAPVEVLPVLQAKHVRGDEDTQGARKVGPL